MLPTDLTYSAELTIGNKLTPNTPDCSQPGSQPQFNIIDTMSTWYVNFMTETSITERYLGNIKDYHENYVLTKTDNFAHLIRNDSLMVIDSHSFNPLQQFHTMKLSHLLIKAGTRFQQKVHWKLLLQLKELKCIFNWQIYPRASRRMIQYHSYLTLEHFISLCLSGNN